MADTTLLSLDAFSLARGKAEVLDNVGFTLGRGQTIGLIGESGAGKSTIALAIIGLLRAPQVALRGSIRFDGAELTTLPEAEYRRLRGNRIGLIFQDATAALNPCFTVGAHLAEPLSRHLGLQGEQRRQRSIELLESVGIGEAALRLDAFPHELSGGMQQRVMIAMALACDPQLLIADEPTSALDVTIQAQIMELILERVRARSASAIFVLHDLALAAQVCDRVVVLYAGQVVEEAPAAELFADPRHPYTRALRACSIELGERDALVPIPGAVPGLEELPGGCRFAPRCERASARCAQTPPLVNDGARRIACWHA
ncbi:MAG: ABC transporter ATP-binding protein [Rhodocyclaceae bacterium]|nr:ABC transporter ATP-binding protein [Rhodocyclaceae bacterium]MCA3073905.1 ABC transporter ATP-binding protein [Rhodocyclaceae bacterium]MCA3089276.1 ABC transporter ATP-binding protein [Rhodocyclaceae bacterium]MCA3092837.1 ABC transporter ATP-binding protein [Rhodocyclaceae bacterium]MCA3097072.1 ABC transporter ATP-binding protein [Rhodocyclaceae bacterium]